MNKKVEKDLKNYLKGLKSGLSQSVYKTIKRRIYVYLKKHPDATMKDIYTEFGTRKEILEENTKKIDFNNLKKKIWSPMQFITPVFIGLAVVAVILIFFLVLSLLDGKYSHNDEAFVLTNLIEANEKTNFRLIFKW